MNSDYNRIGEQYSSQQKLHVDWDKDGPTQFIEKSIAGIEGKILDVGCGTGEIVNRLRKKGYDAIGIDKSNLMRQIAIDTNSIAEDFISVGSMERLGFHNSTFDAIISRFALHYLRDFSQAYSEFHRVLKPAGIIVIVAEHPVCDFKLNKKYGSGIDTSINLFGVKLHFPSHTIKDYFSKDFFKYFMIEDYDEGDERDFPSKVPAYIAFKARKLDK